MKSVKVSNMNERRQNPQDPLDLRSLPPALPTEDGWPAIESALLTQNRRTRAWRRAGNGLAVAATAVLVVSFMLQPEVDTPISESPGLSVTPPTIEAESAPLKEPALESLIAMSQQLEGQVRLYRNQLGDLPSEALVYQVELQDLIVQVDEQLNFSPDSTELWSQRVNLLLDVTQLYENSLRRDYQRMASL
jgi:hypothetical protein